MIWVLLIILILILLSIVILFMSDKKEIEKAKFEVRFEPGNNKYYIVKIADGNETNILGRWGISTLYYSSKIDADFVLQKLNNTDDNTESKEQETKEVK